MPRKFLRRLLPTDSFFREHKHLRWLGALLQDPNVFHLNRRSVSGAVSVGLFMAWVPVPIQMWLAAAVAIVIRVNLPIAVLGVWITNPVTIPPMFLFATQLGAWILGQPLDLLEFHLSWDWLQTRAGEIWKPMILGCSVLGVGGAVLGNLLVRVLWRLHVLRAWNDRRRRRSLAHPPPLKGTLEKLGARGQKTL